MISSTSNTARYFVTIEELQAMGNEAFGRNITVSGAILGDSIRYDALAPRVTFTIVHIPGDPKEVSQAGGLATVLSNAVQDSSAPRLDIVYDGVKPDQLEEEAQAIIRGQLRQDGRFYADELLLKCPSRYEEQFPKQMDGDDAG